MTDPAHKEESCLQRWDRKPFCDRAHTHTTTTHLDCVCRSPQFFFFSRKLEKLLWHYSVKNESGRGGSFSFFFQEWAFFSIPEYEFQVWVHKTAESFVVISPTTHKYTHSTAQWCDLISSRTASFLATCTCRQVGEEVGYQRTLKERRTAE